MYTKDLETVTRTATVMRELADLPFDMQTFEDACERLGKRVADSSLGGDRIGWKYALPDGSELRLGRDKPEGPLMRAFVELYVGGRPDAYYDAREQLLVRQAFDVAYAIALAAAQDAAGPPLRSGIDDNFDEFRLRWALWRGETGLFAVAQCAPDHILDHEVFVDYWVTSWAGGDPHPESDFSNWLPHRAYQW